ncbi:NUDIX hydrolase [Actinoplanes friuliensis]|uniref:NUDIX hydrolase n=1 Tax=Actinoplanes friuliensis DSM 7358 TaxID=1246995 RepID=U5W895_9ACTN|nr:NUDIX domain-containing protein [Actinoplanes friuliensis]AGZ44195.1 NUDIX hydrolase [Actinoplanes friuliensis DSM 7358]
MRKVIRRSVRGLLTDDTGRLLLIRRTRPGLAPYWTVPGGGVEPGDATLQDTLARELREELGAVADDLEQVFLHSSSTPEGLAVQHFFWCRLVSLDEEARTGEEFTDASRGGYDLERISLDEVERVDLKPKELKDFVVRNAEALLSVRV